MRISIKLLIEIIMKISIITVCFNSIKSIRTVFQSVLSQIDIDLEYILIDGSSTDGTIGVIKDYAEKYPQIIKWVSEPDNGMYDAMNKGIVMATGEIIGILNSDDFYASNEILSLVDKIMTTKKIDSCYGNLVYIKNNKPYRYWRSGKQRSFKLGWMPPHPTFFIKKSIYEKYGLYRLNCGINGDYELMLRLLEKNNISTMWLDEVFVYMCAGGKSNNGFQSRLNGLVNDKFAWRINNLSPFFFTLSLKKIQKIPQFFMANFYHLY
jgi:glycosyltransferase involved in cell wall biosynthesis